MTLKCNGWLLARLSECSNVDFGLGNEILVPILLWFDVTHTPFILNFLTAYLFQECQVKCSSAINDVNIDLLSKKSYFSLLLRSVQNQKM